MTKKSDARLKRDAMAATMKQEGVVSPYIELEGMYTSQMALFKPYYEMAQIISNPEVSAYLKDINHTNNLIRTLAADVKDLYQRTKTTYGMHAGKNTLPDAMDENENWAIIQLFQDYQMYMGVHTQTIVPIMLELDEHLRDALNNKQAAQAAAIAAATASAAADQAINTAAINTGVTQVQTGGMTYNVDTAGNPAPHGYNAPVAPVSAAPSMDGYEAAATVSN